MALITCTECGKQFSDRANACPNCGCPTEVILKEIGEKGSADIPSEETIVARYDILGKEFAVTEKLDKSLQMKKHLYDFIPQFSSSIEKVYKSLGTIDKVLEVIPDNLAESLDMCVDNASKILVAHGVYEFDKDRFFTKYEELFDTSDLLSPIVERYLKILDLESEISSYHDYIASTRKNAWAGGGFGIGGAIKGAIKAQMLNYGNAFLHSIPDSRRRAQDQAKVKKLKEELYNDPKSLAAIIDGYTCILTNVMNAVFHELENAGVIEKTDYNARKAESLVKNAIEAENLGMEQRAEICRQAFLTDPLDADVIESILLAFYDYDGIGGLEAYAKQYGFYDAFFARLQAFLEKKYAKEISDFKYSLYDPSTEGICHSIALCKNLAQVRLTVDEYVVDIIENCVSYPLSDPDLAVIMEALCDAGDVFGQDRIEEAVTIILREREKRYGTNASQKGPAEEEKATVSKDSHGDIQKTKRAAAIGKMVAVGDTCVIFRHANGAVYTFGSNGDGVCDDTFDWSDIIAVAARSGYVFGIKSNGTVVTGGWEGHHFCSLAHTATYSLSYQLYISDWSDIIAVDSRNDNIFGLKKNGTVVALNNYNEYGQCNVEDWTSIVAISAGSSHTVGLRSDGTVVAVGSNSSGECNIENWTGIVDVRAASEYTIGLRSDGTVVAAGWNGSGPCNVSKWTDVLAIAINDYHTAGLKSDGTVVATGDNDDGQCNVSGWSNIIAIAVGKNHTVGLRLDGTVVATGDNNDGQCNVSEWTDIVAIAAGETMTVGVRSDGTVVVAGRAGLEKINVGSLKIFNSLDTLEQELKAPRAKRILSEKQKRIRRERLEWLEEYLKKYFPGSKGLFVGKKQKKWQDEMAKAIAQVEQEIKELE